MKWFNTNQIPVILFIGVMMLSTACGGTTTAEPDIDAAVKAKYQERIVELTVEAQLLKLTPTPRPRPTPRPTATPTPQLTTGMVLEIAQNHVRRIFSEYNAGATIIGKGAKDFGSLEWRIVGYNGNGTWRVTVRMLEPIKDVWMRCDLTVVESSKDVHKRHIPFRELYLGLVSTTKDCPLILE